MGYLFCIVLVYLLLNCAKMPLSFRAFCLDLFSILQLDCS